uniref:Uncharacterized protein n=1 Tax=Ananas comosus var. bracteatus TaxID=296719 RepID=A0A6V7NY96_ANACO|nr:unnamed protein product [Ananas comosus var. bracteatus]
MCSFAHLVRVASYKPALRRWPSRYIFAVRDWAPKWIAVERLIPRVRMLTTTGPLGSAPARQPTGGSQGETAFRRSIPVSSSVLASKKRPIETVQSTPPPPPKRRKSIAKRSYSTHAEGIASADVSKKKSEETPSDPISEETPSVDASKQDSVPNEPIEIEGDDSSTIIVSSDTQRKFDECLKIYSNGPPCLAQNPELLDRLYALLIDLADQTDITSSIKCFVETLSSQLSSILARQQSLGADLLSLDQHFHRVDHFKRNIPEIANPIIEVNHKDQTLANQESALQQRISTLKDELTAAESTLAQTSERRLQLQSQLKAKRAEGMKIQEELSQLYKVHPLMKRRRKAAEAAQANLIAEWNQLKDLLI